MIKAIEQIKDILKRETGEAFDNGLRLGIAALERAMYHLKMNDSLLAPKSLKTLAEWVANDLNELKGKQRIAIGPVLDAESIVKQSHDNVSDTPVVTSRYVVEFVFNENEYGQTPEQHIKNFENEIQKALDDNHMSNCRYDAMIFKVVSRDELNEAPARYPQSEGMAD